jgi:hypothetical protein
VIEPAALAIDSHADGRGDGEEDQGGNEEDDNEDNSAGAGGILQRSCLWKNGRKAGAAANRQPQIGCSNKLTRKQSILGPWTQVHHIDNNKRARVLADKLEVAIDAEIAKFTERGELPHYTSEWWLAHELMTKYANEDNKRNWEGPAGQLRAVDTGLSEEQETNIAELANISDVAALHLEFIYTYNYVVSIPSIPARAVFEDGEQNVVPFISTYMSARESPGKTFVYYATIQ